MKISSDDEVEGTSSGFRFELIAESRYDEVMRHLRATFCRDEVLGLSLGNSDALTDSVLRYARRTIDDGAGLHLAAVDVDTGILAGSVVTHSLSRTSKAARRHAGEYDADFEKVLRILDEVDAQVDAFDKYGVDEMFGLSMVSVDAKFRGRGLATELVVRSLRLAKKKGFKVAIGTFTGIFSQKIARKTGFEPVAEIRYDSYVVDGEVVFKNTLPHTCVKLMARTL